jgi:hypothetical protein
VPPLARLPPLLLPPPSGHCSRRCSRRACRRCCPHGMTSYQRPAASCCARAGHLPGHCAAGAAGGRPLLHHARGAHALHAPGEGRSWRRGAPGTQTWGGPPARRRTAWAARAWELVGGMRAGCGMWPERR